MSRSSTPHPHPWDSLDPNQQNTHTLGRGLMSAVSAFLQWAGDKELAGWRLRLGGLGRGASCEMGPECGCLGLCPPLSWCRGRWLPSSLRWGPFRSWLRAGRGPRPAYVLGASQLQLASLVLREGAAPDKHPSPLQTHPGLPCDKNQRSGALKAQFTPSTA